MAVNLFTSSYPPRTEKMRRDHLDRMTKEDLEKSRDRELVIAVLKKIGCQPETNEEGHIVFKYQGDDFLYCCRGWGPLYHDLESVVGIYQHWESGLTLSERNSNLVNVESLVTTIYTADEDEKNVGLHSKCHTLFTPKEGPLDEYLKAMLDHFFITHDSIKENLKRETSP